MPDPLLQGKKSNWLRGLFYCKKYTSAFICSVIFGSLSCYRTLSLSLSCYLTLSLSLTLTLSLSLSRSLSLFLFSQKAQNTKKHLWWKKSELKWAGKKCLSEWQPWWCDATVMVWRYRDGATLLWWCDAAVMVWRYHDGVTLPWWCDAAMMVRR